MQKIESGAPILTSILSISPLFLFLRRISSILVFYVSSPPLPPLVLSLNLFSTSLSPLSLSVPYLLGSLLPFSLLTSLTLSLVLLVSLLSLPSITTSLRILFASFHDSSVASPLGHCSSLDAEKVALDLAIKNCMAHLSSCSFSVYFFTNSLALILSLNSGPKTLLSFVFLSI